MHEVRALHVREGALGRPDRAVDRHPEHGEHEAVGRDREERTRLADAAQVHRRQRHHQHAGHGGLVTGEHRDRRSRVLDAGRHRHGHRQHVVDEQRGGHRHPGPLAEVDLGDLVVTAAAGVGVHVLPVGGHHREHHDRDGDVDPPAEDVRRGAGHREHDEDLVRCVGHRRQRVAREDGQRDALRQQRVSQLGAAQLAAEQDPLRDISDAHTWRLEHCAPLRRRTY